MTIKDESDLYLAMTKVVPSASHVAEAEAWFRSIDPKIRVEMLRMLATMPKNMCNGAGFTRLWLVSAGAKGSKTRFYVFPSSARHRVESGRLCPVCVRERVRNEGLSADGPILIHHFSCEACEAQWQI